MHLVNAMQFEFNRENIKIRDLSLIISAMKVTSLPKNKVLKSFCFFI